MKHVYNKSSNFVESYVVHFYINGSSDLTETVPVIAIAGMVSRTHLHNIRNYLKSVICSLIKPAAMETIISSHPPTQIHTVML